MTGLNDHALCEQCHAADLEVSARPEGAINSLLIYSGVIAEPIGGLRYSRGAVLIALVHLWVSLRGLAGPMSRRLTTILSITAGSPRAAKRPSVKTLRQVRLVAMYDDGRSAVAVSDRGRLRLMRLNFVATIIGAGLAGAAAAEALAAPTASRLKQRRTRG